MKKTLRDPSLLNQEASSAKWFLVLFYIFYLGFDVIYDLITRYFLKAKDPVPNVLGIWQYLIMFLLLPIVVYLFRKHQHYKIKYLYFFTYTFLSLINDCLSYFGSPENYRTGSSVEIFFQLACPIFVSTPFFKVVTLGLLTKYIIVGLVLRSPTVFMPILVVVVISIFSYILLTRFQSYVKAIKSSYDHQLIGLVKGVIATLELKDPYTRGHSERVATYALELAKSCKMFSQDELKEFHFACLLHDIGKIHIPDQILMKPTSLTQEEYEVIKSHTTVGAEAVSKVIGLNNRIDVIRSHHERWDGKGYPDQLAGNDIPVLARIAAIADAFDAMTSSRSYRSALPVEEAYQRIIQGSGTQFDPNFVEAFKTIFPQWKAIHQDWSHRPENQQVHVYSQN